MKKLLAFLFALLLCSVAWADLVARNESNELRLMPGACVHGGVLGLLKPEWRSKFHKAQASVGGKTFFACWVDTGDGYYFVAWESGEGAAYPIQAFVDEPGA